MLKPPTTPPILFIHTHRPGNLATGTGFKPCRTIPRVMCRISASGCSRVSFTSPKPDFSFFQSVFDFTKAAFMLIPQKVCKPKSSNLKPHSSPLTPQSSLLTPHSSLLTPHSSNPIPPPQLHKHPRMVQIRVSMRYAVRINLLQRRSYWRIKPNFCCCFQRVAQVF